MEYLNACQAGLVLLLLCSFSSGDARGLTADGGGDTGANSILSSSDPIRSQVLPKLHDHQDVSGQSHAARDLYKVSVTFTIPKTLRFRSEDTQINLPQRVRDTKPYVDLAEDGWTTPVKEQGSAACVSAWVHAALSVIESAVFKQTGNPLVPLSRQAALDCINIKRGVRYKDDAGCNGGYVEDVFAFLTQFSLPAESAYPYVSGRIGRTRLCQRQYLSLRPENATQAINPIYFVRGASIDGEAWPWQNIMEVADNRTYQSALVHGPLVTFWNLNNINRSDTANPYDTQFLGYRKGVYSGSGCASNKNVNHAMMMVGYCTTRKPPYWIFQNSWGTRWGEAGFIRVLMTAKLPGPCGMYHNSLQPILLLNASVPPQSPAPSSSINPSPISEWSYPPWH